MGQKGSIVVFTGEGKGKTTAALGMAMRAVGHGFRVAFLQFIKGTRSYGELEAAKRLKPELELEPLGEGFVHVDPLNPDPRDLEVTRRAWEVCKEKILSGEYFMVVLDEINYALSYGLLPVAEVLEVLKKRPDHVHVVLTGRNAPQELIELADLVTEMKEIKHPYAKGIVSRKGIEY